VTPYKNVNKFLEDFLFQVKKILGDKLVGLYLYGSLTWEDFDIDISDIDLLAVLSVDLNENEALALEKMHKDIIRDYKQWEGRIDVQYLSEEGLKTYKSKTSKMARIASGYPFQVIDAGLDWIMNWYFVLDNGVILFGPKPSKFIDPISKQEFFQSVKDQAKWWKMNLAKTEKDRPYQSYVILTMCRALYSVKNKGEQVSKIKASKWVKEQLPEHSDLIDEALLWRKNSKNRKIAHELTYSKTREFVLLLIDQITKA
ncbi:MAG: DUF4111 domain-containing protein, partial [Patescibacteria group bacterium]|nr:DUF4111 domain-containing protein [Patescibacteria group bacterium]